MFFWISLAFLMIQWMLEIWSLVPLPFLKPAWTSGSSRCRKKESEVTQLCPTLCDPVECSPPASSVHGILQARILEWVAISFSRGSSRPRDRTQVSHIAGRCFNLWATREATSKKKKKIKKEFCLKTDFWLKNIEKIAAKQFNCKQFNCGWLVSSRKIGLQSRIAPPKSSTYFISSLL